MSLGRENWREREREREEREREKIRVPARRERGVRLGEFKPKGEFGRGARRGREEGNQEDADSAWGRRRMRWGQILGMEFAGQRNGGIEFVDGCG